MTNEEKAKQIAKDNRVCYFEGDIGWGAKESYSEDECFESALQMADWKDAQFAEERKALIDKACKWLKNNIDDYYTTCEFEQWFDEMVDDFKEAMEE